MPTYIYDKKSLIKFVKENIDDDKMIVLTNELTGNLSISKKSGIKVTHQYSEEVFNDTGIGHIAFKATIPLGLMIADKSRLSKKAMEFFNKKKPKKQIS